MTTNEAAERLFDWVSDLSPEAMRNFKWRVNEALAAERRATVERMENEGVVYWGDDEHRQQFLDEEAAR